MCHSQLPGMSLSSGAAQSAAALAGSPWSWLPEHIAIQVELAGASRALCAVEAESVGPAVGSTAERPAGTAGPAVRRFVLFDPEDLEEAALRLQRNFRARRRRTREEAARKIQAAFRNFSVRKFSRDICSELALWLADLENKRRRNAPELSTDRGHNDIDIDVDQWYMSDEVMAEKGRKNLEVKRQCIVPEFSMDSGSEDVEAKSGRRGLQPSAEKRFARRPNGHGGFGSVRLAGAALPDAVAERPRLRLPRGTYAGAGGPAPGGALCETRAEDASGDVRKEGTAESYRERIRRLSMPLLSPSGDLRLRHSSHGIPAPAGSSKPPADELISLMGVFREAAEAAPAAAGEYAKRRTHAPSVSGRPSGAQSSASRASAIWASIRPQMVRALESEPRRPSNGSVSTLTSACSSMVAAAEQASTEAPSSPGC